jgi:hypothetical protein
MYDQTVIDAALKKAKARDIEEKMLDALGIGYKDTGIKGERQKAYERELEPNMDAGRKAQRAREYEDASWYWGKPKLAYEGKAPEGSKMRSALIDLGIPVKDMTTEEKAQKEAAEKKAAALAEIKRKAEEARLARIAQVGTSLTPAQSFVTSGQSGLSGPGISPYSLLNRGN